MRILACSYEHIGPFLDHAMMVRFLPGASLIKAPIGSGKSFLFFDGPIFGLYKWSTRPMISRHASQGQIQVLFTHAGAQWLIIRALKATKAGNDSVTSKLFRVQVSTEELDRLFTARFDQEIVCPQVTVTDVVDAGWCEEISALGQKEIDTMILDLLPSREVTLSSCVLMQESDNVFDMSPALRITVFKQLFDLLDMDHVRDHLAELKRTTQLRRQVLQEDMTVQHQFSTQYTQVRSLLEQIRGMSAGVAHKQVKLWLEQPFFLDIVQFDLQEVHLEGSFMQGYDEAQTRSLLAILDELLQAQLMRQGQGQQLLVQYEEIKKLLLEKRQEQTTLEVRLEVIALQLDQGAIAQVRAIEQKIQEIDMHLDLLWQQVPVVKASTYGLIFTSITQAQQVMYAQITEAKQLQQELVQLEEKQVLLVQQVQQTRAQIIDIEQQLARLADDQERAQAYRCEKIQAHCPYVVAIRKMSTGQLDAQATYLYEQKDKLCNKMLPTLVQQIDEIEKKKEQVTICIQEKKQLFVTLGWKDLEVLFQRADALVHERTKQVDMLRTLHARIEQFTTLLEEQQQGYQRLEQLRGDYIQKQQESELLARQLTGIDTTQIHSAVQELKQILQILQRVEQLMGQIAGLVEQFVERQQSIRELQDKEVLLKDLLQVFQKELLIVVLQDFLPVLEEVINSYLQQVVAFSLRFELPKTMQEQIELAIWIEDEKGQRAVKSLSGGQRAVLRLCRILAVSTLFKQEYLLFDETINSLDHEAIGRVAELLDGFIKQREVTFYLVTHASQIQQMPFWRRVIELHPQS